MAKEPGRESEDGNITASDGVGGLEKRRGAVRILETSEVGCWGGGRSQGSAESWASSGKGKWTPLSISGHCGTMVQK